MAHPDDTLRQLAHETVDKLAELRDDVRVRLHLASMDVRDAWKVAEPRIERAETRLRDVLDATVPGGAEAARLQLKLGLAEVRDHLKELEPQIRALATTMDDSRRAAIAGLREALSAIELG